MLVRVQQFARGSCAAFSQLSKLPGGGLLCGVQPALHAGGPCSHAHAAWSFDACAPPHVEKKAQRLGGRRRLPLPLHAGRW